MPAMNGTGPGGYGPMTGRGMGRCGGDVCFGGQGAGVGMARSYGRGRGAGYGPGRRLGPGRGLGWFATGYQDGDELAAGESIRSALETRIAALQAELTRTEDLLKTSNTALKSGEGSSK